MARVIDGRRDAVAIVGGETEGVTFLEGLVGSGTERMLKSFCLNDGPKKYLIVLTIKTKVTALTYIIALEHR